jgi:LPPG:FO 2-phospho-L-lactate transferase
MNVVLLAGGLGGARLAPALVRELGAGAVTIIANVGDDIEWMGLRVCPDMDSITYALAGVWHRERGWGRRDETFVVRGALGTIGRPDTPSWFGVGDRDIALHLERTRMLREGKTLTAATREISSRLGVEAATVVPASDEPSVTRVRLRDERVLGFQEWYVREAAQPEVVQTLLATTPGSPAAIDALASADVVVLAPSNPVTSIGAILALDGMRAAVARAPRRLGVSPVVAARPSDNPTIAHHARARARVLHAIGCDDRPAAVAARYGDLLTHFVVDEADRREAAPISELGFQLVVCDTLDDDALAKTLCDLVEPRSRSA